MTTLNTNLDKIVINFASANQTKELILSDLPTETIDYLLQGATRKFNDSVNSMAKAAKDKGEEVDYNKLIEIVINKAKTGDFAESHQPNPDKAFKVFVLQYLRNVAKIPAKTLESVKGATPEVILATAFPNKTKKAITNGLDLLHKQFELTQVSLDLF